MVSMAEPEDETLATDLTSIPTDYRAGYEKARQMAPETAANYVAHTLIGDPLADAMLEDLSDVSRQEQALLFQAALLEQDWESLADAPSSAREFFEDTEKVPDGVDFDSFIPGIRMFHWNSHLILGAFVGGTLIEGFATNISKAFFISGRVRDQGVRRLRQNNRHMIDIFMPYGWRLCLLHTQGRRQVVEMDTNKLNIWTISDDEKEQRTGRCEHLGGSLLTIANGLRAFDDVGNGLKWAPNSVSTELYKVLVDGMNSKPLLNCLTSPTMPALDYGLLRGDAYELHPPLAFGISPLDQDETSTGLTTSVASHIYPLHGLSYNSTTSMFEGNAPWNKKTPHVPLADWVGQDLVHITHIRRSILDVMKRMRNKRGAHTDKNWGSDIPHTFRPFYLAYAGIFLFHVGRYLINQALSAAMSDSEFSDMVFPGISRLEEALRIPSSVHGKYHMSLLPGEKSIRSVEFEGDLRPWVFDSVHHDVDPRIKVTSCLFFMSAPLATIDLQRKDGATTVELHRAGSPPLILDNVPTPVIDEIYTSL